MKSYLGAIKIVTILMVTMLTACGNANDVMPTGTAETGGAPALPLAPPTGGTSGTVTGGTGGMTMVQTGGTGMTMMMQDAAVMNMHNDDDGGSGMTLACPSGQCDCPVGVNCDFDCSNGGCLGEAKCQGGNCTAACPDGNCVLECDDGSCDYSCEGGGCEIDCEGGAECILSCTGGGCDIKCEEGATCAVDCETSGAACQVTCEEGGTVTTCEGQCEETGCGG